MAVKCCEHSVSACSDCKQVDPVHGVKPAELIRDIAKKLVATLQAHASQQHKAQPVTIHGTAAVVQSPKVDSIEAQGHASLAETIPRQILQCLQAVASDSEDAPSLQAMNVIVAPFTKGKDEGCRPPDTQLQAISLWLAQRLGGETTAPKLKTLLLLEKLLSVGHGDNTSVLLSECKAAALACLEWSNVDPRHGDRPAALVREKARVVASLFESTQQGGSTG